MGFLDELAAHGVLGGGGGSSTPIAPTGRTGGLGSSQSGYSTAGFLSSLKPFIDTMRNRDLMDIKAQLDMFNAPHLRQNFGGRRTRDLSRDNTEKPMDVIYQPSMSDYQRANLGLEREKLNQNARFGEGRQAIQNERLALDQLKNQQIFTTKANDMERKMEEADRRLELAYAQLRSQGDNANAIAQYRQAQIDAITARNEAQIAQRDRQLDETKRMNDARIEQLYDAMNNAGYSVSETEIDPEGRRRTTVTRKGQQPTRGGDIELPNRTGQTDPRLQPGETVPMTGKDGKVYYIPKDKVSEAERQYGMRRK